MASYTNPETGEHYDRGPDDFMSDSNTATNNDGGPNTSFDQAQWDREWAAWEAYEANPNRDKIEEFDVKDDVPTDTDHDFGDTGKFPPPTVPGGDGDGEPGSTEVSTAAMKTFAANIKSLVDPMQTSWTDMGNVKIAAGGFHEAFTLRDKVMGPNGLAMSTQKFIGDTRETMADIAIAAEELAAKYTSVEEFNSMTGKDLGTYVSELNGDINGL
jgi:hypothetical protein